MLRQPHEHHLAEALFESCISDDRAGEASGTPVAQEEFGGEDLPGLGALTLDRKCGTHGYVQRVQIADGASRHDVAAHTRSVADLSTCEPALANCTRA